MSTLKKLVIIDSNALIHRAYHALPPLKTKEGQLINAVYGFISILFRVVQELKPDYLIAAFDFPGPTFRNAEYKEYKAKRVKAPDELYNQIPLVKKFVRAMDIPVYEKKGFEADDIIGTIVEKLKDKKIKIVIVTGDLDILQLVSQKTEIYVPKGIKETIIYDKKAIKERYGLTPEQITDFKGLKGDPSDNICGVPGIGEKTALDLIKRFGSLNRLYQELSLSSLNPKLKARLLEYKEQAFFSKHLATIKKDIPLDFELAKSKWRRFNHPKAIKLLEQFEFKSLVKRLSEVK
jgi:DNA polymerase-1